MKKAEKMQYLLDNHYGEWTAALRTAKRELSMRQAFVCICGKLATGMHESTCSRFRNRAEGMAIKELAHLWKGVK